MPTLHSESIEKIATALNVVQQAMATAKKNAENPYFSKTYADLSSIWAVCREPLGANGLAITQLPDIQDGQQVLVTMLLHESGQWLSSALRLTPVKSKDHVESPTDDPQVMGSAITYARRYALAAILGIIVEGEDDDAQAASSPDAHPNGENYGECPIHPGYHWKIKGKMTTPAHPIEGTDEWCEKGETPRAEPVPEQVQMAAQATVNAQEDRTGQEAFDALGSASDEEIGNLGDFMTKALKEDYGVASAVMAKLGIKKQAELLEKYQTFDAAWEELVK